MLTTHLSSMDYTPEIRFQVLGRLTLNRLIFAEIFLCIWHLFELDVTVLIMISYVQLPSF